MNSLYKLNTWIMKNISKNIINMKVKIENINLINKKENIDNNINLKEIV